MIKQKYFLVFLSGVPMLFLENQHVTSSSQYSYAERSSKRHNKTIVMKLFCKKVPDFNLTKSDFITVSCSSSEWFCKIAVPKKSLKETFTLILIKT